MPTDTSSKRGKEAASKNAKADQKVPLQPEGGDQVPVPGRSRRKSSGSAPGGGAGAGTGLRSQTELFVRGIPPDADGDALAAFFSEVGPVRHAFVVADTAGPSSYQASLAEPPASSAAAPARRNKGYGFVHFAVPEDAARAITDLAKTPFRGGRPLLMELAVRKKVAREAKEKDGKLPIDISKPKTGTGSEAKNKASRKRHAETDIASGSEPAEGNLVAADDFNLAASTMSASKKARKEAGSTSTANPTPKNLDAVTGNDKQKSKSKKKEKKKKAAGPAEADSLTLVIRNIPFDCDDAALKKIFTRHGTVTRVWLPEQDAPATSSPADAALALETEKSPANMMQEQQKRTRNRGFAFVRMSTLAEADAALERVNATKIRGRVVAVDRVVPREELMAAKESAADEDNDSAAGDEAAFDNEQSEVDDPRDTLGDVDGIDDDSEEGSGEDHQHGDDESVDIQFEPEDDGGFGSASTQTGRKNNAAKDDATVFIRNLSFDSTEEGLRERFSSFGRVRYAVVTVDPNSGRPRGTGFVSFVAAADAEKCLAAYAEAERAANLAEGIEKIESSAGAAAKTTASARAKKAAVNGASSSILVPEPSSTAPGAAPFVLDGRQLLVTRAVSRNEAARLAAAGAGDPSSRDRRNTYLLREGLVEPGTEAARGMPAEDLEKRQRSYTERRRLLQSNPNLYVSRTRLSVRNLPVRVDAPLLRRAAILAVCRFWEEVYDRQRSGLEKAVIDQELNEGKQTPGASRRVVIKKCQIQHDESRIDSESGKPRSKGYGFIDFESHADALACLRWLNNNPLAFNAQGLPTSREELAALRAAGGHEVSSAGASSAPGKRAQQRRPVVEFAIENIIIVRRKQALAEGFRLKAAARAEADAATKGAGAAGSERQQRREKRRRQAPSHAPDAGDAAPAKRRKQNPAAPTGAAASAAPAAGAKGSSRASPGSNAKVASAAADDGRRGKADKHGGKKQAVVSRAERRDQAEEDRFNALLDRYGKGLFGDRAASVSTAAARSEAGASVPVGGSGISKWYS